MPRKIVPSPPNTITNSQPAASLLAVTSAIPTPDSSPSETETAIPLASKPEAAARAISKAVGCAA
ncbi:unannotated protein [freshwater metagenome]|uniref:Unannotated protein n=1 Tax=freshwater metagenome TaxID=449393 RepID=A0A6J6K1R9_9ZZZZ